jgi:hypothetical protein
MTFYDKPHSSPPEKANAKARASREPLQDFAHAVAVARRAFNAERGISAWLIFYEAKQAAYTNLVTALPQVDGIEDFWRYVQSMAPAAWLPIIERELKRIVGHHCRNCPTPIPVTRLLCDDCRRAMRAETLRAAQARKREEDKLPRCPECGTNPIRPEQRKCDACKREARRSRNRRHRKSLKEVKVRRVEADFTQQSLVNTPPKPIMVHPPSTVDVLSVSGGLEQKGVLV